MINFDSQFPIFYKNDCKKRWFFYDVKLSETNILIEVNGDYWHANPAVYKSDDLIHFRTQTITANDIWMKDKKKKQVANEQGYVVLTIWEKDLIQMSDDDVLKFIFNFIEKNENVNETDKN